VEELRSLQVLRKTEATAAMKHRVPLFLRENKAFRPTVLKEATGPSVLRSLQTAVSREFRTMFLHRVKASRKEVLRNPEPVRRPTVQAMKIRAEAQAEQRKEAAVHQDNQAEL